MFGNIELLDKNQIPGKNTFNKVAKAIKYMRSLNDGLSITIGPDGGIWFDIAAFSLTDWMATAAFLADFGGTITGQKLVVSGGSVLWPGQAISVSGLTINNVSNGRKVWCAVSSNTAALNSGSSFPQYVSGNTASATINIPILEVVSQNSELHVKYHHVGDIHFPICPYFWIPGYNDTKKQSLDHGVGGALEWTDYEEWECNQ